MRLAASRCFGSLNEPPPSGETTCLIPTPLHPVKTMRSKALVTTLATTLAISFSAFAAEEHVTDVGTLDASKVGAAFKKRPYSPYADRKFPMKPLFGETHLHTGFSMDAGAFG